MSDLDFGIDLLADALTDPLGDSLSDFLRLIDLGTQAAPAEQASSLPVHTVELESLTLTAIRVEYGSTVSYQLYGVTDATWVLVGIFGLFTDTLREIRQWRAYVAAGGSLETWTQQHPEGIQPELSGFGWAVV